MEERWNIWKPNCNIKFERKYYIKAIIDNPDGLFLFLFGTEKNSRITVQFPGVVLAYRSAEELVMLEKMNVIVQNSDHCLISEWTFFVVENSIFAKEVEQGSQEIYHYDQMIHFAIISGESFFEAITYTYPEISEGWDIAPYGSENAAIIGTQE